MPTRPPPPPGPKTLATFYGDCAFDHLNELYMKYPIRYGHISDWDSMEKLWAHAFYMQLGVTTEDQPVLLTEPTGNSQRNRERTLTTMFETFDVPLLGLVNQAVLSLYATGATTGCVLESGHESSQVVPIYDGCVLPNTTTVKLGGRDITSYLVRLLSTSTSKASSSSSSSNNNGNKTIHLPHHIADRIKELTAYAAYDYHTESTTPVDSTSSTFTLPDGARVELGQERFQCTEALFQPYACSKQSLFCYSYTNSQGHMEGLPEIIDRTILQQHDKTIQSLLYGNIVLSGGNTMFNGMAKRLTKDLSKRLMDGHSDIKVKVTSSRSVQRYGAWVGGSMMAEMVGKEGCYDRDKWISRKEYLEYGASAVLHHRLC